MNTKDKIIQTSMALFNQYGERVITTNHIASEMGISPGNLYYHFKNKEDILRHIFSLYRAHLQKSFTPTSKDKDVLCQLADYLSSIVELMWRFNFLYSNLTDILSRDKELKAQYLAQQEELLAQVVDVINGLKHADLITIDDSDVVEFAHLVKLTVSFWTPYLKAHTVDLNISKRDIYGGIVKVVLLFKPYAKGEGLVQLKKLQKEYTEKQLEIDQAVA
jgi:AcrR family transcriptional regulator